jgi:hypothetical protein
MAVDAQFDDICEYCKKPIWVHLKHKIATSPYIHRKPNGDEYWIHEQCQIELRDKALAEEAEQELIGVEQQRIADSSLQEYDRHILPPTSGRFVRIEEAAYRAHMSVSTMHKVIREGYARSYKKNGYTFVELPAVKEQPR